MPASTSSPSFLSHIHRRATSYHHLSPISPSSSTIHLPHLILIPFTTCCFTPCLSAHAITGSILLSCCYFMPQSFTALFILVLNVDSLMTSSISLSMSSTSLTIIQPSQYLLPFLIRRYW